MAVYYAFCLLLMVINRWDPCFASRCYNVSPSDVCLMSTEMPQLSTRGTNVVVTAELAKTEFCDVYAIDSGRWYQSRAAMTTECPAMYMCGTKFPIWLSGTNPTENLTFTNLTACLRDYESCCLRTYSIVAVNCGETMAYCFNELPSGCHQRYCFGPVQTVTPSLPETSVPSLTGSDGGRTSTTRLLDEPTSFPTTSPAPTGGRTSVNTLSDEPTSFPTTSSAPIGGRTSTTMLLDETTSFRTTTSAPTKGRTSTATPTEYREKEEKTNIIVILTVCLAVLLVTTVVLVVVIVCRSRAKPKEPGAKYAGTHGVHVDLNQYFQFKSSKPVTCSMQEAVHKKQYESLKGVIGEREMGVRNTTPDHTYSILCVEHPDTDRHNEAPPAYESLYTRSSVVNETETVTAEEEHYHVLP